MNNINNIVPHNVKISFIDVKIKISLFTMNQDKLQAASDAKASSNFTYQ